MMYSRVKSEYCCDRRISSRVIALFNRLVALSKRHEDSVLESDFVVLFVRSFVSETQC